MHALHRDFLMEYEKYIPLGRMTVAEDLVGTAIFLASEASASRSQPDRVRLREQGRKQSARSSHAVCLPTW
jgi:hypothetical protein